MFLLLFTNLSSLRIPKSTFLTQKLLKRPLAPNRKGKDQIFLQVMCSLFWRMLRSPQGPMTGARTETWWWKILEWGKKQGGVSYGQCLNSLRATHILVLPWKMSPVLLVLYTFWGGPTEYKRLRGARLFKVSTWSVFDLDFFSCHLCACIVNLVVASICKYPQV